MVAESEVAAAAYQESEVVLAGRAEEEGRLRASLNAALAGRGTLAGQPVQGILYFFQVGTTLCSISGVAIPPGDAKYQPDLQAMIDSLEPVKR